PGRRRNATGRSAWLPRSGRNRTRTGRAVRRSQRQRRTPARSLRDLGRADLRGVARLDGMTRTTAIDVGSASCTRLVELAEPQIKDRADREGEDERGGPAPARHQLQLVVRGRGPVFPEDRG